MNLFFITFGVILFLVLIMAIGVLFGRKPIAGSCGGYDALKVECVAGCKMPCEKRLAAITRAREAADVGMDTD